MARLLRAVYNAPNASRTKEAFDDQEENQLAALLKSSSVDCVIDQEL
jgi:hypothetical protein